MTPTAPTPPAAEPTLGPNAGLLPREAYDLVFGVKFRGQVDGPARNAQNDGWFAVIASTSGVWTWRLPDDGPETLTGLGGCWVVRR